MGFIAAWFFGEERVWKPFYLGSLLGIFLASLVAAILQSVGTIGTVLSFTVLEVYFVWLAVSIWNCAYNVDWKLWVHLARAYIVYMAIANLVFFVMLMMLIFPEYRIAHNDLHNLTPSVGDPEAQRATQTSAAQSDCGYPVTSQSACPVQSPTHRQDL